MAEVVKEIPFDTKLAPGDKVNERAEPVFNKMVANGDLTGVALFPNHDADNSANPTGYIMLSTDDTVVVPEMLHDDLFETFIEVKVDDPRRLLKDAMFVEKRDQLAKATPSTSATPCMLAAQQVKESKSLTDKDQWAPSIGTDKGFVGIYKRKTVDSHFGGKYSILVRASVPSTIQELRDYVETHNNTPGNSPMTMGQLIKDPIFGRAREISLRNASRLAWNAARSLGLSVETTQDGRGYETVHISKPVIAVPANSQLISDIRPISFKNKPYIAVLNQAAPVEKNTHRLFVIQGPVQGILEFNTNGSDVQVALPCTTRRNDAPENHVPDPEYIDNVNSCFTYQNQSSNPFHQDLLEGAFTSADDTYRDGLRVLGMKNVVQQAAFQPIAVVLGAKAK